MSIVKHFRSITPVPLHCVTITVTRHLSSIDSSVQGSAGDSGGGGGINGKPTGVSGGSSGGGGGGMLHSAAAAARTVASVVLIVRLSPVSVDLYWPRKASYTTTSVQFTPVAVSDRRRPVSGGTGGGGDGGGNGVGGNGGGGTGGGLDGFGGASGAPAGVFGGGTGGGLDGGEGATGAAGCCKRRSGRRHFLGPNSVIRSLARSSSLGVWPHCQHEELSRNRVAHFL